MEDVLKFKYDNKGKQEVFPVNNLVKNWLFQEDEKDEATLAHSLAVVAEKNGMSVNDLMHLYPYVLRMVKSRIDWSK
jgi:hypothetical protein